jgi:hypothetical protein
MSLSISSNCLSVTEERNDSVFLGSINDDFTHSIRWNSMEKRMEYERNGYWYQVPSQQIRIDLPANLTELARWGDREWYENTYSHRSNILTDILEWITIYRNSYQKLKSELGGNPTMADAWQDVELALEKFIMLKELVKQEKKVNI